jgi:flagellar basal-body rod protein FlgC
VDLLFRSMSVSASGLTAERFHMAVIANNLANLETSQTPGGGPYRRQSVVFAERLAGASPVAIPASLGGGALEPPGDGVEVVGIVEDPVPSRRVYDPGNPLADAQGYVQQSNVSPVLEMVDLMSAANNYRANVTALQEAKEMMTAALALGR